MHKYLHAGLDEMASTWIHTIDIMSTGGFSLQRLFGEHSQSVK